MPISNEPQPFVIPRTLREELYDLNTPWRTSSRLTDNLMPPSADSLYKRAQVLPQDKEWDFVWQYFHADKPHQYGIKRIWCVNAREQQRVFESSLVQQEAESETFPPTWDQEPRAEQRAEVANRWEQIAGYFSPFSCQNEDGHTRTFNHTKIIPLWHGTSQERCHSICSTGFVFFGKKSMGGDQPHSTDDGYFGSGIYLTDSPRYAADIYSTGALIMAWVSMRKPFLVVREDRDTLQGHGAYKSYNAHYIPVVPENKDLSCAVYLPAQPGEIPICDEYVVFQKSQTLPRFWVELEVEVPNLMNPRVVPRVVCELIPHLMQILQNPTVDGDVYLRKCLKQELGILLARKPAASLSKHHTKLFTYLAHLIVEGEFSKSIRDRIIAEHVRHLAILSNPHKNKVAEKPNKQEQEYLRKINQDPVNPEHYHNLAIILPTGKMIALKGTPMTNQQLYLMTIALDPAFALAYYNLGLTLTSGETVTLLDETKMTQRELYLKAIDLDPLHAGAYAYYNLGLTLTSGETVTFLDGIMEMTKQQLYLMTIALDPDFAAAYYSLGLTLSSGETITLSGETKMTKQELYLKAIDLDPDFVGAYYNLGITLSHDERIHLLDGRVMTKRMLYLQAISLTQSDPEPYYGMGNSLAADEKITLLNGTVMTKQELYLKAIALNPHFAPAYSALGSTLSPGMTISLNGKEVTRQQLCLRTIALAPAFAFAYYCLASTLSPGETMYLFDGSTKMTQRELCLKAIHLDPHLTGCYMYLANLLSPGETITLLNGKRLSKQQLAARASK